jgi:GT2 family glycosyltransferase
MIEKQPHFSVIIVSYNVKELLLKCIQSLINFSEEITAEIIVVDNNSSDNTVNSVKQHFPEVKIIANNFNAGFSAANNTGIKNAKSDVIFLLNPDTEINNAVFSKLYSEIEKDVIVAQRMFKIECILQIYSHKFPGLFTIFAEVFYLHRLLRVNDYPVKYFNHTFNPDWASGAALVFSISVLEKTGYLDEDLFWMEDVDYCYRARKAGIKVKYIPDIEVIHHSGKSSTGNLNIVIANQLISKVKYIARHKGEMAESMAATMVLFHIVSRIIIFLILSPLRSVYKSKMNAYLFSLTKLTNYIFRNEKGIIRK